MNELQLSEEIDAGMAPLAHNSRPAGCARFPNNAYLIAEANDLSTAKWVIAKGSWQALDKAKAIGFSEKRGFSVVATIKRVDDLQNIQAICPDWPY